MPVNPPIGTSPASFWSCPLTSATARDHVMIVPIFVDRQPGTNSPVIRVEGTSLSYDSVGFREELTTVDIDFLADMARGRVTPELLEAVVIAVRRALADFTV